LCVILTIRYLFHAWNKRMWIQYRNLKWVIVFSKWHISYIKDNFWHWQDDAESGMVGVVDKQELKKALSVSCGCVVAVWVYSHFYYLHMIRMLIFHLINLPNYDDVFYKNQWYGRSGRYCHSSILDIISPFCHLIATLWPIWFVVFKMKIVETGHLTLTI
jgi:hypothetical protein